MPTQRSLSPSLPRGSPITPPLTRRTTIHSKQRQNKGSTCGTWPLRPPKSGKRMVFMPPPSTLTSFWNSSRIVQSSLDSTISWTSNVRTFLTKIQDTRNEIDSLQNDGIKYDEHHFRTLTFNKLGKIAGISSQMSSTIPQHSTSAPSLLIWDTGYCFYL